MSDAAITGILQDEATQAYLHEFGLQDSSPEMQEELLDRTGALLLKRLTLEILKKLPSHEAQAEFDKLLFSGADLDAWKDFLKPYIKDLDAFVSDVMEKEVSALREAVQPRR